MEPGARPLLDYHPGSARYAPPQDPPSLTTKVGATKVLVGGENCKAPRGHDSTKTGIASR